MNKLKRVRKEIKKPTYSVFQLIEALQTHEILWNRQHKNFHSREKREEAWTKVGCKLYHDFERKAKSEQLEIVAGFVKRWKNCRDSFFRVHKMRLNDQTIHPYIYEKEMSFLISPKTEVVDEETDKETPSTSAAKTASALDFEADNIEELCRQLHEDNDDDDDVADEVKLSQSDFNEQQSKIDDHLLIAKEDHSSPSPPIKKRKSTMVQQHSNGMHNATLEFESDAGTNTTTTILPSSSFVSISTDADQAFFDSIKPNIRSMSAGDKLDFQIEVLKLLRQYANK